jgi:hypothetical protein
MNKAEINKIVDNNSVVFADNGLVEATYDLGDNEDAERFATKAENLADKYNGLDIQIDILCDEAYEEDDMPEWNIANISIDFDGKSDLLYIKEFLDEVDCI